MLGENPEKLVKLGEVYTEEICTLINPDT